MRCSRSDALIFFATQKETGPCKDLLLCGLSVVPDSEGETLLILFLIREDIFRRIYTVKGN